MKQLKNYYLIAVSIAVTACDNSNKFEDIEFAVVDNVYTDDMEFESDISIHSSQEVDSNTIIVGGMNFDPPPTPASRLIGNIRSFHSRQKQFSPLANQISRRYGVEPYLTHAIISQESAYKPRAQSYAGAVGLMQLIPSTGRTFGCVNRTDPNCNITAGVKYLKSLARYFEGKGGNLQTIAAGYNAGQGVAMSYLTGTRLKGKNPRARKTPNGVPVKSFGQGQTYDYAQKVAGYYLYYKRNPETIGLVSYQKRESTCLERELC